jgi:hypothetical protein
MPITDFNPSPPVYNAAFAPRHDLNETLEPLEHMPQTHSSEIWQLASELSPEPRGYTVPYDETGISGYDDLRYGKSGPL